MYGIKTADAVDDAAVDAVHIKAIDPTNTSQNQPPQPPPQPPPATLPINKSKK